MNKKAADDEDDESEQKEDKTSVSVRDATGTDIVTDDDELESDEELTGSKASLLDKFKKFLPQSKASAKASAGDKTPAEKKKTNIIRGIIVLAIVVLIAQEFFPSEEDAPAEPALVLKPRERPKKKVKPTTEDAATTAETPATTPTDSTEVTPSDTTATPTPTPTPDVPPLNDTVTPTDSPVTVTTTDTPENPATVETPVEPPVDTTTGQTPVEPTTPETESTSTPTTPIPTDTQLGGQPSSPDSVDGQDTASSDENLTDKILQDLENQAKVTEKRAPKTEYTNPPDYEYKGRGLVYNCLGKHWACVDAPSYQTCEDNSSSVKFLKRKVECYPFNVYETPKGCESIQNRMVSSSAKTDFCKE